MGGNSSKSSVQQVNEFFNKTTNDFVSANSNKVDASNMSQQSIDASGVTIDGCRVNFNQTITSGTVSTGKMENKTIQDLTADLKNKAQAAIDNAASQKNGFLNTSIANSTEATTNLKNSVTNVIENTMKSTNVQEVFAKAQNVQINKLSGMTMKCYPEYRFKNEWDLQVNQNIKSDVVAKGVADNLTKDLSKLIEDNLSLIHI